MARFFVKRGYDEHGPLTASQLKKLKINKSTFVRREGEDSWFTAENVYELKNLTDVGVGNANKWFAILFMAVAVIGTIVILSIAKFPFISVNKPSFEKNVERLPIPPKIDVDVSYHKKRLLSELVKTCNLSGEKKQLVDACNFTHPTLRNRAVSIAGAHPGSYNLGQVCDIFDYCYNNWKYVDDPKKCEIVEYASNTISNGLNGDCDDFAVLVCSMVLSIGGEARINYAFGQNGGHAFTEVNIGNVEIEKYITLRYQSVYDNSGIRTRIDQEGNKWLNLDWFAKYPGGKYFECVHGTTFYILQRYCTDFIYQ